MYRTDKQYLKDPATAPARIYAGNLADSVVPDNLDEKFKVYGKVLGMLLQKGFAFIQFETEQQAQDAIQNEHGSFFHGRKIIVRRVFEGKNKGQNPQKNQPPHKNNQQNHPNQQTKPPEKDGPPVAPPPGGPDGVEEMSQDKRGNKRKFWRNDRKPMDNYRDGPPPYYEDQKFQSPIAPYAPPIMDAPPEKNDCEIIVVSKALTEYAEYIEQRLKSLGLIVDLLFPNEDVPLGRVLANISSRGCLYAILVMPQNEENRSLTLNILHGIPQEHRNMPVEDAMILITRNFAAYMRGEKTEPDGPTSSLTEKHPEAIQMIFNLLAENRQLTVAQYDKIIKYLQDRRELQKTFEGGEEGQAAEPEPNSKEAELQSRIMNILNKPSSEPTKAVSPAAAAPTPLLNDPSVQKALDSLLLGDMFKSISGV